MDSVTRFFRWFTRAPKLDSLEPPKPLPEEPSSGRSSSITKQFPDRWGTHPGFLLTPKRITSVFLRAEEGFPREQCDLFEDVVEQDAHLRSLCATRIIGVAGKPWILQAGDTSAGAVKAAEVLSDALQAVPNLLETFAHQLMAPAYGYAASEIVWERRDGWIVPTWFANVPHRRFLFRGDEDEIRLATWLDSIQGLELRAGSWMVSRGIHRLAVKAGYMRSAVWWSYFKRLSVRDWSILCERFGMPFVVGKYSMNNSEELKKQIRRIVQSFGIDGGAAIEEGASIELLKNESGGGSGGVHSALSSFCNAEMSKLVTGATLTADTGTAGSYAQSRVHETRGFDYTLADAESLGTRFEQDLGKTFCHFNGLAVKPPRLKIHVVRDVDPKTRAEVLAILQKMGLVLDGEQVRQEFQLKQPGTEPLALPEPEPAAPATPV